MNYIIEPLRAKAARIQAANPTLEVTLGRDFIAVSKRDKNGIDKITSQEIDAAKAVL